MSMLSPVWAQVATGNAPTINAPAVNTPATTAPTASVHTINVTGSVEITPGPSRQAPGNTGVVVWLTPIANGEPTQVSASPGHARRVYTVLQKNKTFEPHLLVIPAGSDVEFPNKDPFFHNVFSLFDGRRFDLGLYEAGTSKTLRFDRPGVSYLFCNIHSEMSAVIVTLDSPFYSVSDTKGRLSIASVPPGRYTLHVWREGSSPGELKSMVRSVVLSQDANSLGKLVIADNNPFPRTHKNKYGRDYDNPTPPGQVYQH
jgi:plastocyanin